MSVTFLAFFAQLLVFGGVSCLQGKFSYPYELFLFDLGMEK